MPDTKWTATHRDFMHPKHLRVLHAGIAVCMSPTHSQYNRLYRDSLPVWRGACHG